MLSTYHQPIHDHSPLTKWKELWVGRFTAWQLLREDKVCFNQTINHCGRTETQSTHMTSPVKWRINGRNQNKPKTTNSTFSTTSVSVHFISLMHEKHLKNLSGSRADPTSLDVTGCFSIDEQTPFISSRGWDWPGETGFYWKHCCSNSSDFKAWACFCCAFFTLNTSFLVIRHFIHQLTHPLRHSVLFNLYLCLIHWSNAPYSNYY